MSGLTDKNVSSNALAVTFKYYGKPSYVNFNVTVDGKTYLVRYDATELKDAGTKGITVTGNINMDPADYIPLDDNCVPASPSAYTITMQTEDANGNKSTESSAKKFTPVDLAKLVKGVKLSAQYVTPTILELKLSKAIKPAVPGAYKLCIYVDGDTETCERDSTDTILTFKADCTTKHTIKVTLKTSTGLEQEIGTIETAATDADTIWKATPKVTFTPVASRSVKITVTEGHADKYVI